MSIKKKPSEPEAHVDFIGVLKPEHEPFLVKPDPTNINYILFTKGEIPEHILQGIQNYYLDPSKPKPKLLENILSFERSNLLPPPEHTRLKRRLEEKFPGLLQELINKEILSPWGSIASILGLIVSSVALWLAWPSLPKVTQDFIKDAFPSKDALYLIGIGMYQILGLLASVATLIMFVYWLRRRR